MTGKKTTKETKCNAFLNRLKEATGCANISELSRFFDVSPSTISRWAGKKTLPDGQDAPVLLRGVNPDWVRSGRGKKLAAAPAAPPCAFQAVACPLRVEIKRMLKICGHCEAWAAVFQLDGGRQ